MLYTVYLLLYKLCQNINHSEPSRLVFHSTEPNLRSSWSFYYLLC